MVRTLHGELWFSFLEQSQVRFCGRHVYTSGSHAYPLGQDFASLPLVPQTLVYFQFNMYLC